MLPRLSVRGNQIVNASGEPVRLRGVCIGGWMNMENFINGYPGAEHGARAAMADVLGKAKAEFFFDRMLDHFLTEEDLMFVRGCGATVVRLPINYRHFESDAEPFRYNEKGFARLSKAIDWCEKAGLYAILDLHAVQGWQNPDWHSDNGIRRALFWKHAQFQDRFVALWEEIARRFKDRRVIAGYNVMNEPVTGSSFGRFSHNYQADWETLNRVYRRVAKAIRTIDPDPILFLEGDCFSVFFDGLDAPFDRDLAYSSHNYNAAGFGPGVYPGNFQGEFWDREKQLKAFLAHQGTEYAKKNDVPLWVGEFGSVYNGPPEERGSRLQAVDDQLSVFESHGIHWTMWTFKDVGVMGWMSLDPECDYLQRIAYVRKAKQELATDFWMHWMPNTHSRDLVNQLADEVERVVGPEELDGPGNRLFMTQATLDIYVGALIQPLYAKRFAGLSEAELDRVLESFSFRRCRPREDLLTIVKRHLTGGKPSETGGSKWGTHAPAYSL